MHGGTHEPNIWITYGITALVVLAVLAFRMRSMNRLRPLRLERLWVLPAIYTLIGAMAFAGHPPSSAGWLFALVALGLGAVLGWQRGKMMQIHVDPETHALNQKASPAAFLFIVALIVVRQAARIAVESGSDMHVDPLIITDILIAFAIGMFSAQRIEMYLRAKRLLEAARARH
ncbi:cytochrome c biogenesis protein CcdC [Stakelama sp. CBK3Z-3]|uniref:Cytochrome c biogenesis protein CcdC n=2 Tax=Stakelama flava TaxID=2860338 RepID=A0ABS6XMP5_9SPHN|nr:cytochrome c biogenesis protein CcdC [Stakelama flava]